METKNLCAQIPLTLHARVTQGKEESDSPSLSEYITEVLTAYYNYIEKKGENNMNGNRTLAFQIPEELFQRVKNHVARETARLGKKVTQRDFVVGLIQRALDKAEAALFSFSPAFHRHGGVSARRSPVVALCGRFRGGVASLPLPEMKGRVGQVWAKFQKPM